MRVSEYAKMYAKQFGLKEERYQTIGAKTFCDNGKVVAWYHIREPNIFNYLATDGQWKKCKTSDLALAIINETKIH
jgi:hypothetical protein